MKKIDVSVVLNMHREAPYLRAALLSLDACARTAQMAGLRCELVAVFDRADVPTRQIFDETKIDGFVSCSVVEVDVGSLGLARNAGIAVTRGEFIWTADGDDLVSQNAIVELYKTATEQPEVDCAIFMEYLVAFGEQFHIAKYFDSSYLTVADFAYRHPYVSRIFLRKKVLDQHKYADLRVTSGYAYEDWDFIVRLRRLGFRFFVAPNTIFYYRQRFGSLLKQADTTSARMIPHTPFFDSKWFIEELDREKQRAGNWHSFIEKRQSICLCDFAKELVHSPVMRAELVEASKLDPEVELSQIENSLSYCSVPIQIDHLGFRLAEAFRIVGEVHFTDVVLLPSLNPGGDEKYILQVLHALADAESNSNFLVLCGEPAERHAWAAKLPRRSVLLDVYNAFPTLNDDDRDRLAVRLLLAVVAPKARFHIKASVFAHRLIDAYGSILLDHFSGVYYRFSDQRYIWQGLNLDAPYALKFLRKHLSSLHWIICDCDNIAQQDKARIGLAPEHYHVICAAAYGRQKKENNAHPLKRLLWVSQICDGKRPELLVPLAINLRRLYPDLVIDIHGHVDPGHDPCRLFDDPGLKYVGPNDDLESLPLTCYDAFLYTSAFDGMPNVVLEALAAGLPVIAPDLGGIREIVISGQTGYLVPDEANDSELIGHYVEAIKMLYEEWDATLAMPEAAHKLIQECHSPAAFSRRVFEVFEANSSTRSLPTNLV